MSSMAPLPPITARSSSPPKSFSPAVLLAAMCLGAVLLAIFHRVVGGADIPPLNTTASLLGLGSGAYLFCQRALAARCRVGPEAVRLLLLAGLASFAIHPFLTVQFVGGQDAKWYAYVLADHVEQSRAGVFPVMVGLGAYQFNGAVHPFRFAPFYQTLGSFIDLITGRTLSVIGLQHATVLVASWLSAFSSYFAFTAWAPQRRWLSWICAGLWILSPAATALLCVHDMYMSFMAAAWVPLAIHCALRIGETRTFFSAAALSAVLAILFNCHPPVALWTAFLCFGLTASMLWSLRAGWRTLGLPAVAAISLIALNAFQFQGIAELSPVSQEATPWREIAGVALTLCAALTVAHGLSAPTRVGRFLRFGREAWSRHQASIGGIFAAVVTMVLFAWISGGSTSVVVSDSLAFSAKFGLSSLLRVSASGTALSDVSPGGVLLAGGALAAMLAWRMTDSRAVGLTLAAVGLCLVLVPTTPVARSFWHTAPKELIAASSGVVNLRVTPAWTGTLVFAGFGALVYLAERRPKAYRAMLALGALAIAWSGWELTRILRFSTSLTMSEEQSRLIMAPENAPLFIYSGNFIGLPDYFSHGVRDYRTESRLLNGTTGEPTPAKKVAEVVEPASGGVTLTGSASVGGGEWVYFEPTLSLPAGKTLDLVFDFGRGEPRGVMVIESTYFYREYVLPSSGSARSFGSGATNSQELAVWSTAQVDQPLQFRFRPDPGERSLSAGSIFATVTSRIRDNEKPAVRVLSLIPHYRAQIDTGEGAMLETPRTWIPGYQATRNGATVEVTPSRNNLVTLPLVAGHNAVELRFVGSPKLQRAFLFSCAAWVVFVGLALSRHRVARVFT